MRVLPREARMPAFRFGHLCAPRFHSIRYGRTRVALQHKALQVRRIISSRAQAEQRRTARVLAKKQLANNSQSEPKTDSSGWITRRRMPHAHPASCSRKAQHGTSSSSQPSKHNVKSAPPARRSTDRWESLVRRQPTPAPPRLWPLQQSPRAVVC